MTSNLWGIFDEYDSYDPDDEAYQPPRNQRPHEYPRTVLAQRVQWSQAARAQPEPFEDPALEAMTGHSFLVDLNTPDRTKYDQDVAHALRWLQLGHPFPGVFPESDPGDEA